MRLSTHSNAAASSGNIKKRLLHGRIMPARRIQSAQQSGIWSSGICGLLASTIAVMKDGKLQQMWSVLWRLHLRVGIGFAIVGEIGIGHSGWRGYSGGVGKRAACRCTDRPVGCVDDAAADRHCDRRITDVARARVREA